MKSKVTIYDGGDCIGGNKIHLQAGDTGVFLDFGMNFSAMGRYFEEFLQPRIATHGVHDLLSLGIVPALRDIYRPDAFIGPDPIKGPAPKVDAVFLSHAHADHVGHLGLLRSDIPIYCSHMTAMMIKATQDCGGVGIDGENTCFTRRYVDDSGTLPKLAKTKEIYQRCYMMVDWSDRHDEVQGYWGEHIVSDRTKNNKDYFFDRKPLNQASGVIGQMSFEAIPVDHSVYGATAYVFVVDGKTICYTGDFRMHGWRPEVSAAFRNRLREIKPDCLIVEGTNVGSFKGNDTDVQQRASEEDVHKNCLQAVRDARGKLVIADFGLRNIERLLIFLKIASETGRKLAVTVKDLFFMHAMGNADAAIKEAIKQPDLVVYEKTKGGYEDEWEKVMRSLYEDKYLTFPDIQRSPGDYILAFSFWDIKELSDLQPAEGIYIYSTCEAFSEEMEIDVWRLGNWLRQFNLETVGIEYKNLGNSPSECEIEFVRGYHASGHVSENELFEMISEVKPKTVIPVHTEHPEVFAQRLGKDINVILPQNAIPIEL